ncbi:hypothetical protein PsorP6_008651 [Peronosclerospora sorghi]|uniref:Uncharacterized protein n=1 Tax=Peronosclerospora sorghi TaxID=230839 RepID=A0ACC0WB99_9STRA|nr:hypothetical protein PsorP6_008651 [Peronosclerospora sorghi]
MELCEMCGVHGPSSEHELAIAPPPNIYRIGNYEVEFESAKNLICNQGTYVLETFQNIECTEPQHFHLLIQSVVELFLEDEFAALVQARRREPQFKKVLDDRDNKTSFEKGWSVTGKRFPLLQEFVGGIATVFPGTSTIESDFSEIT